MIFQRYRKGTERVSRVLPRKLASHPTATMRCPACDVELRGRETVLLALGPGDDEAARERHRLGAWYSAVAIELHAECAGR